MNRGIHERFHIRTLDELRAAIARLDLAMPVEEDLSVLGTSLQLAGRMVPNRFAAQPMEGFDSSPDGSPGPLSFRRYRRYAEGGFGLIWFEATAVMHEARSNPNQLCLYKGNVSAFRDLLEGTRKAAKSTMGHDIVAVIQLTHSGRYSKPRGHPAPIIAHHSPILDPRHSLPEDYPLVTDEYLDRLLDTYVAAAELAAQAGFDGVDVKSCHRYLVSELLASFTRDGKYGGSFENRTRMLREALTRIGRSVKDVFVTTRMNAYDAISHPYGFGVDPDDYRVPDLAEPKQLAAALRDIGAPLLNVSIGNPYFNPHYGRPYDFPVEGVQVPDDNPLAGLDRFITITREMQAHVRDLPMVGSGYTWLRHLMPYVAAGVINGGGAAFLGIGRGAFAYPDTPKDVLKSGAMDPEKCCVTCSACTQLMRDGAKTGCVVRDSRIYGPEYRKARRFSLDRLREEAARCRNCEYATCRKECPAGVDIPGFISAFLDDDIPAAYDILRDANVLPEMCAYVCPSEVQCEGGCLEDIFRENPVPIRDIQLGVCRLARERGLTGVRVPAEPPVGTVAVVGAGPAGIAATIVLMEKGRRVVLFDKSPHLGGIPDQAIPDARYGKSDAELDAILRPAIDAERLSIRAGQELGTDIALDDLRAEHDAVLIAVGLGQSPCLTDDSPGVDAMTFLARVKSGDITSVPDKVAVLGAGNAAMDAATAALNLGASDVYLVYRRSFAEMPAWPSERDNFMAAGGHCLLLTQPVGYETDSEDNVTGLRIARTELGEPDESGRRRPQVIPDTESTLTVGMVIEALGQSLQPALRDALADIAFTDSGLVQVGRNSFATNLDGVYAAGDLVNGGTTAVRAVAEGMKAAAEIDRALHAAERKQE